MLEVLDLLYPWLKVAHLLFVIFWMAGLFMLPRFFVYHQEAAEGSEERSRWIDRERRLLKIILNPAVVMVWIFGIALAFVVDAWSQPWFHLKLLLVTLLTAYHGYMAAYAKKLAAGDEALSGKKLRLLNEVPGIAAILILVSIFIVRIYLP